VVVFLNLSGILYKVSFWRDNVFGFDLIRGVWLWKCDVTARNGSLNLLAPEFDI
jgi:hypothetical protein